MMSTFSGSVSVSWVWLHLHWLFWGIAIFGFIVALIWMSKYAKKDDVNKIMWTTLVIGILGGLLTVPLARSGWYDMMGSNNRGFGGGGLQTMMGDGDFMQKMLEHMSE